jgi:hypothetical protein
LLCWNSQKYWGGHGIFGSGFGEWNIQCQFVDSFLKLKTMAFGLITQTAASHVVLLLFIIFSILLLSSIHPCQACQSALSSVASFLSFDPARIQPPAAEQTAECA